MTKPNYVGETCPIASFITTDLSCTDLGPKPGHREGNLATNRLYCGKT